MGLYNMYALFSLWLYNSMLISLCKSESISAFFHFNDLCSRLQNDLGRKGQLSCPTVKQESSKVYQACNFPASNLRTDITE